MNTRLKEDDLRRAFNANRRVLVSTLKKNPLIGTRWSIHLIRNNTCDGNEFQLRFDNKPYSGGHLSWQGAFNAIPEDERNTL